MEASEYHVLPCGPGLMEGRAWLADLCGLSPEGCQQSGYLGDAFTGIRRKSGFLREIEHPSNPSKPGLSFRTWKPNHRAYGAERFFLPDL